MITRMSIPERAGIMRDLRDKLFETIIFCRVISFSLYNSIRFL